MASAIFLQEQSDAPFRRTERSNHFAIDWAYFAALPPNLNILPMAASRRMLVPQASGLDGSFPEEELEADSSFPEERLDVDVDVDVDVDLPEVGF